MMNWTKEARDMGPDPASGAMIVRLSGSSIRTENIYCEAPRSTPDGRRVATFRYIDEITTADPDGIVNVFSAEIPAGFLESLG